MLVSLKELRSLNLVGTKVSADGLLALTNISHLQNIYLFQTNVDSNKWLQLKKSFPKTVLDTGGYKVPVFASDTTEFVKELKHP